MTATSRWSARWLLLVVCLALAGISSAAIKVECSEDACTMESGTAHFDINEYGSFLYLLDQGQPRYDLSSLSLGFSHIIERARLKITSNTSVCSFPTMSPYGTANSDGEDVGEIVAAYNLSSVPRTFEYSQNYPYPGVHTVIVRYSKPATLEHLVTITYSLPETSFTITEAGDPANTCGFVPTSTYRENSLKIGMYLEDFGWTGPTYPAVYNNSFLIIYANVSANRVDGDLLTTTQWNSTYATLTNSIYNYSLQYYLEHFFYLDGVAYLAACTATPTTYGPYPIGVPPSFAAIRICKEGVGHWRNLTYDPGIGVLFSSFDTSNAPTESPSQAKSRKTATIAAAVAVPVVFVAVASVVLMVLYVKPVYNAVLPSDPLRRNKKNVVVKEGGLAAGSAPGSNTSSAPAPSKPDSDGPPKSWTSSHKPNITH